MEKYINRLLSEWIQHGKIIISVDYDSTVFPYPTIDNLSDIKRTVDLVKLAHDTGAYIVIFTASNIDRYEEIQKYCEEIGLPIDAINKNPIDLPYGNNGKIYYNINLCDRSGLNESLDILEQTMYKYRGINETNKIKNLNEIA